jgi:predicted esterase
MRAWWVLLVVGCAETQSAQVYFDATPLEQPSAKPDVPDEVEPEPPTGLVDTTFVDERGRSARFAALIPDDVGERSLGALIYFHADGYAAQYRERLAMVRDSAESHGLIAVSVQEPDREFWWAPNSATNAAWVSAFVDTMVDAYDLDPERVFIAGASGGASFGTGWHLLDGYRYGGGVIGLCGADIPRLDVPDPTGFDYDGDDPPAAPVPAELSPETLDSVRYYLAIGPRDSLRPLSEAAATFYEDLGFAVTHELIASPGHCGFPIRDQIATGMDFVDPE